MLNITQCNGRLFDVVLDFKNLLYMCVIVNYHLCSVSAYRVTQSKVNPDIQDAARPIYHECQID